MDETAAPTTSTIQELPQSLVRGSSDSRVPETDSVRGAPIASIVSGEIVDRTDFVWNVHSYINEYIRFADAKAGFSVAFSSAVAWALINGSKHDLINASLKDWGWLNVLCAMSFFLLAVSLFASVRAVLPRLYTHPSEGFIYWGAIGAHKTAHEFTKHFRALASSDLESQLTTHLHTLSRIATKKYWWINISMLAGAIGSLIGFVVLLVKP